jgi:hypothetical protein
MDFAQDVKHPVNGALEGPVELPEDGAHFIPGQDDGTLNRLAR